MIDACKMGCMYVLTQQKILKMPWTVIQTKDDLKLILII